MDYSYILSLYHAKVKLSFSDPFLRRFPGQPDVRRGVDALDRRPLLLFFAHEICLSEKVIIIMMRLLYHFEPENAIDRRGIIGDMTDGC